MKTINETFDDGEMEALKLVKGNLSWHKFIMKLATKEAMKEAEESRRTMVDERIKMEDNKYSIQQ